MATLLAMEAIDTDHNGHPLRKADNMRLQRCRDKVPDCLNLMIGARVILHRNINIGSGWVNGTLWCHCIVVQKLTNSAHRYPVPRFRDTGCLIQHIETAVSSAISLWSHSTQNPGLYNAKYNSLP